MSLACFGGEPDRGATKQRISQNCLMKNVKAHFLWIEDGLRIQMSPRNHKSSIMAGKKGHFSVQGGGVEISLGDNFAGKISPLRNLAKFSPGEILAPACCSFGPSV